MTDDTCGAFTSGAQRAETVDPIAVIAKFMARIAELEAQKADMLAALIACTKSLHGYRRELEESQQCDAERAAHAAIAKATGSNTGLHDDRTAVSHTADPIVKP